MSPARQIRTRSVSGDPGALPATMNPVLRRVLLGRGIKSGAELSLGLRDMQGPSKLQGIDRAAEMLADAVSSDKKILIVGDFDADGATGTALAVLSLQAMGARRVEFRVPNRFEFGYGLTPALVEAFSADPPDVLVTVDSGISCIDGVEKARGLGCEVIITDHHLPGKSLPEAHAIVNPNQPGDSFPSKALAGVGVMFYLLGVVRSVLRGRGWFDAGRAEPNLAQFLDLVALGTVADLVPLDHNNRVLVRQGLERIRCARTRPGVMALLRLGKRDYRHVNAADLGFVVGPRLNAAGRLEDMSAGIRCLLSSDPDEAGQLAAELDELNRRRRNMQEQMQQQAMQQADRLLGELEENRPDSALCLFDESWHQGIVGLVASRVKEVVRRPVIAFAPESEGADLLKGSARSVRGLHIRDVLAVVQANYPGLMQAFGGHAMAAGLSLPRGSLAGFEAALNEAVETVLDGSRLTDEIETDGSLAASELNLATATALEQAGPWGQRFPEPLFDDAFEVIERRVVGGSHLKMIVCKPGGGDELDAIAFNRLPENLPASGPVRMLYRLGINRWRGRESCQLMVEEMVL